MNLSVKKIKAAFADPAKTAGMVNLVYVNDTQEGIVRVKKGKSFAYYFKKEKVKDKDILQRIKKLVIPPAWRNVWICKSEDGHLQVTGYDVRNRKQYKYHTLWNAVRNHTKYYRLQDFGKAIPTVRLQLDADLKRPGLPQEKVLAAVVSLMELTSIRVGNGFYEKLYGSFGLTTLKDRHVSISGTKMQFTFKGKKGVAHNISIKSKRLANIVKQCRDLPGKELFQYIDESGERRSIDSGMVNQYIKHISGQDFTAKDFRTWSGTVTALDAFKELGCCDTVTGTKQNIVSALDIVSKHLGNTRTVCKKYYVHPVIISMYENKKLQQYFDCADEECREMINLNPTEKLLMKILEKEAMKVQLPAA